MANYKVAYGKKENMNTAIELGIIPPGCIILTEDSSEIYFYDLEGNLKTYEERYKFESYEEAEHWVQHYDCKGQIMSVHEGNKCSLYIVGYDNNLSKINSESISYTHEQSTPASIWVIQHNLNKCPVINAVDTLGSMIVGEINYVDHSKVELHFSQPIAGTAYLS